MMVRYLGSRLGMVATLSFCSACIIAPASRGAVAFGVVPKQTTATAAAWTEQQHMAGLVDFSAGPIDPSIGGGASLGRSSQAFCVAAVLGLAAAFLGVGLSEQPAAAESAQVRSKIMAGGASSITKTVKKNITRGVRLDDANYSGQDLTGIAFQQSIVRYGNFKGAKLVGASFFDADLEGSDFSGAEMSQANLELARCTKTIFDNAVATEMYVNGTTQMMPISIDGADFTDTPFRKDQKDYLCKIAKGTNPVTKVSTRESLMCPE